jgi:hypothetical protein
MEYWFRGIFLSAALLTGYANGQQTESPPLVLEPQVERRDINEADIDTEDFELGVFAGFISIEDFSNSAIIGARFTYHISESIFTELSFGQAEAGQTSFEILSGGAPFLTEQERDFRYYDLSLGYRFSGETFVTQNWVFNSDFYLQAGAGYRLLLTDWLVVRFDAKDIVFDSELIGPEKTTHNLTYSLGLSVFF